MIVLDEATEADLAIDAKTVALLPVGTTEGHGAYLPHGTDTFVAVELARRVAARYENSIVLPGLAYGMSEHYSGVGFPVTLSPETEAIVVTDICESLIRSGISRIFVVNGHDGNIASIEVAGRAIRKRHGITIASLEAWWLALANVVPGDPALAIPGGHAGTQETALTMAARPELVHMERAPQPTQPEDSTYFNPLGGVRVYAHYTDYHKRGQFADPTAASEEMGQRLMDALAGHILAFLQHADESDWKFGSANRP